MLYSHSYLMCVALLYTTHTQHNNKVASHQYKVVFILLRIIIWVRRAGNTGTMYNERQSQNIAPEPAVHDIIILTINVVQDTIHRSTEYIDSLTWMYNPWCWHCPPQWTVQCEDSPQSPLRRCLPPVHLSRRLENRPPPSRSQTRPDGTCYRRICDSAGKQADVPPEASIKNWRQTNKYTRTRQGVSCAIAVSCHIMGEMEVTI